MNAKATQIIKHYESLHDGDLKTIGLQPKMCPVGLWTVGWGRAIVDPKTSKFLKGLGDKKRAYELYPSLSIAEAEQFLQEDYTSREKVIRSLLRTKLNDDQVGALTSFAYNIGLGNFQSSSLLRLINLGKLAEAMPEFDKWRLGMNPNTGKREILPGLVARRKSERLLFEKGEVKFFN